MYKMIQEYTSCPPETRRFTFNEWKKRVDDDFGHVYALLVDYVDDHRGVTPTLVQIMELIRFMEFNTVQSFMHTRVNTDELRGRQKALRDIHELIEGLIPKEDDDA